MILKEIFAEPKPIIGMVHLHALPGSPQYNPARMDLKAITATAVEEARKMEEAGVDGIQIENIWDYPYLKGDDVGHETTAAMTAIATEVTRATSIPLGVNCHLNAGMQALAVATAVGAQWIRVFEWVNAYVSHAGIIEGIGAHLARYRSFLKAEGIKFFCDVNVKHGSHFIISDRSVSEQAFDAASEGAEALVVTGFETGIAPSPEKVKEFVSSSNLPVLIGSGAKIENVTELLTYADGAIVGSFFKKEQDWKKPVDEGAVREFMQVVKEFRKGLA